MGSIILVVCEDVNKLILLHRHEENKNNKNWLFNLLGSGLGYLLNFLVVGVSSSCCWASGNFVEKAAFESRIGPRQRLE